MLGMAGGTDFDRNVDYLRDVQYRDSTELAKRANLHVADRTAPELAFDVFARLVDWPAGGRVLDVGCGAGYLWEHVAAIAPDGIHLVLSDLSTGMVDEAVDRARATGRFASVEGAVRDARRLGFDDRSFDVAVSTYALYHVPEPTIAVAELARVVRDDGCVAVMTNGPGHLREIEEVRVDVFGESARYQVNRTFAPSVAASMLTDVFDQVCWHRYDDTLRVTDADDVLAFVTSTPPANEASDDQLGRLDRLIRERMADGEFVVNKHTGSFICRRPRRTGPAD